MMKRLILLGASIFFFRINFAQKFLVSASTDKDSILIGEHLHLTLKATLPKGQFAFFTIDSIPHFEIVNRSATDSQVTEQGLVLQQKITLTSWDSGKFIIPSFNLGKARTTPLGITVSYSAFDTKQPYHDIKEIIPAEKPAESNWYWYIIGAACLLILIFLFFPRGKKPAKKIQEEATDPFITAMQKLEKLKSESSRQIEVKIFYTTLIDIFRDYIHKRKNIESHAQTTDHLSGQLEGLLLPGSFYKSLVNVLSLSDMVKFARHEPLANENADSIKVIENAIRSIEQIK